MQIWDGLQDIIENRDFHMYVYSCGLADVAKAHVLAAETPTAKGRYLVCTPHEVSGLMVVDALKKRFPQYKFDVKEAHDTGAKPFANNSRVGGS